MVYTVKCLSKIDHKASNILIMFKQASNIVGKVDKGSSGAVVQLQSDKCVECSGSWSEWYGCAV